MGRCRVRKEKKSEIIFHWKAQSFYIAFEIDLKLTYKKGNKCREKYYSKCVCTVENFSKQLVQCFLVFSSCSWFRWCRSVCWHCDSCDSLPGHFCSCGPICVSQESSRLWVWYYWLFGAQWRLSAGEHQGSEARLVHIALHTCDLCMWPVSLCGSEISDFQVM